MVSIKFRFRVIQRSNKSCIGQSVREFQVVNRIQDKFLSVTDTKWKVLNGSKSEGSLLNNKI